MHRNRTTLDLRTLMTVHNHFEYKSSTMSINKSAIMAETSSIVGYMHGNCAVSFMRLIDTIHIFRLIWFEINSYYVRTRPFRSYFIMHIVQYVCAFVRIKYNKHFWIIEKSTRLGFVNEKTWKKSFLIEWDRFLTIHFKATYNSIKSLYTVTIIDTPYIFILHDNV